MISIVGRAKSRESNLEESESNKIKSENFKEYIKVKKKKKKKKKIHKTQIILIFGCTNIIFYNYCSF